MNVALNAFSAPSWSSGSKRAAVESPPPPDKGSLDEDSHARTEVSILPLSDGALLTRYETTGTYIVSYTGNYSKVPALAMASFNIHFIFSTRCESSFSPSGPPLRFLAGHSRDYDIMSLILFDLF